MATKPTMCSFFSGAGFFDYGFKEDFEIVWANELCPKAASSYRANVGNHMRVVNIEEIPLAEIPEADVYVGTPPCQDFSSDGANRGEDGDRGRLVWVFERIVAAKRPKAFVMENVVGLTRKHKTTLERLVAAFERDGYQVTTTLVDTADYGVPQHRERVFLLGIRTDISLFSLEFPKPVVGNWQTVAESWVGLHEPEEADVRDHKLGEVPNHLVTWTSPTPERIRDVIANPRPNQRRGMRRLPLDSPSFTLTHHMGKDGREFLHPIEDRRISVREALRVMGVPDEYVIPPEINIRDQYFLVGNGVPTPMGEAIAEALHRQLTDVLVHSHVRKLSLAS